MSSPGSLSEEPQPEPQPTSPRTEQQPTEKEFQFLQCQSCQKEAKCPKLLPCLHSLCSGCLKTPDSQCPICKVPGPTGGELSAQDNVFFESLQRRLSIYRMIMDEMALCARCKETTDFWCSECEQLLCTRCFEAHQWFLAKHEPRPIGELRRLSELEFLDSLRKTNNIFCSHPDHGSITTNIYCRGCSKPICCSCAVLDSGHNDLRSHVSEEIEQRQEELESMTHKLREKKEAFGTALAQVRSNFSQLHQQHTDNEELISSIFGQVVALVQAQERQLLEKENLQYQCNYQKLAGQQQHQDTVLQRICTGSTLVQKMKCYASDQEVLDMHDFLRQALHCLYQEKPHGTEAIVYINVFNELKACLQRIVSDITQVIDAEVSRRESSQANNLPQNCLDVDLVESGDLGVSESDDVQISERTLCAPGDSSPIQPTAEEVQVQASIPAQAQSEAVVQSVPGAHPVPVRAYSISVPSYRKEDLPPVIPQKRKSCQNENPRKMMKMDSKEEREARLAESTPEQPRPSTSRTISLPHLEEASSRKECPMENESSDPNRDVLVKDPKEAAEMCVVVISSSEDSNTQNSVHSPRLDHSTMQEQKLLNGGPDGPGKPASPPPDLSLKFCAGNHLESAEIAGPPSLPDQPLQTSPGVSHPIPDTRPVFNRHIPKVEIPLLLAKQDAVPSAQSHSQPVSHLQLDSVQRGTAYPPLRILRIPRFRLSRGIRLPLPRAPPRSCPATATQTLQDNNGNSNETSDVQLEGPSSVRATDRSLADPGTEDRPLVFFDLKIDNETQKIRQLAALKGENKFQLLITPQTCFSDCSNRVSRVSLEEGFKHFLNFLRSMHRPVLACYKLWGPSLPKFFRALNDIKQLRELKKTTSGFLAVLPLIQERVPGASSFQLSDLSSTYLARNMNESTALASVLAMRDLCHFLEVSQGPHLIPYIYSFSNLRCFASLQPLVQAAVLPRPEARLLALNNVSFLELLTEYRQDPQGGLKKYNRYLSLPDPPTQHADRLRALKCYFESILQNSASTQQEDTAMPTSSHSHGYGMVKKT